MNSCWIARLIGERNKLKQLQNRSQSLLGWSRQGHLCFLIISQDLKENCLWGLGENNIKWIRSAVKDHNETGEVVQNQFILFIIFWLPSSRLFRCGSDGSNWSSEYLRSFFGPLILAYQFQQFYLPEWNGLLPFEGNPCYIFL